MSWEDFKIPVGIVITLLSFLVVLSFVIFPTKTEAQSMIDNTIGKVYSVLDKRLDTIEQKLDKIMWELKIEKNSNNNN